MVNSEHDIIRKIEAAKKNPEAAELLIETYMPFIKTQTAKVIKRIPQEENDDELSIAMFAFYEAIMHYNQKKGSFIKLAETAIRNRLVDYIRKEQRHRGTLSLETPVYEDGDEETKRTIMEGLTAGKSEIDRSEEIMAAADEIQQFSRQLMDFGITLTEVAEACPKQERTLNVCLKLLEYARCNPKVLEQLLKSKKLPVQLICEETGVQRKTVERHRKYIVAIMLAFTNGFEIIRGHLCQLKQEVR